MRLAHWRYSQWRFFQVLPAVLISAAVNLSTPAWAIRGGIDAANSELVRAGQHQWVQGVVKLMALHEAESKYVCTGAIIAHDLVLTSAHCFDTGHSDWQIVVENQSHDEVYEVAEIGIHQQYRREEVFDAYWNFLLEIRLHNDLALVKTRIPFNQAYTLALPIVDEKSLATPASMQDFYLVGFGQTEHLFGIGEGEGLLRVAGPVQATLASAARMAFKNLSVGACLGDSGAPLLMHTEQGLVITAVLSQSDCLGNSTYQRVALTQLHSEHFNWGPLQKRIALVVKE